MLLVYEGPPDSYDPDVARALAAARVDVDVELPDSRPGAAEGATVTVTNPGSEASGYLEPGRVYDLPTRLAEHRLETSAHWHRVSKIGDLTQEQLQRLAAERGVEGRSKLTGKELAKAVSSAPSATLPDPDPETAAPAGGDTAPAVAAPAGATTAAATTAGGTT